MEKKLKIGKKEVRLDNNMAWTMEYKDQFGKDILPVIMPLIASGIEGLSAIIEEAGSGEISVADLAAAVQGRTLEIFMPMFQVEFVDIVINVAWSMAKAADENIDPPKQWIRQFEEFPLDDIIPAVYELVIKGSVSSKNRKRLKKLGESLKNLQPSHSTQSFSPVSSED